MEEIRVEKGMEENSPRSKPFCFFFFFLTFNYLFTPCWEKPHLFSKGYKSNFKEKKGMDGVSEKNAVHNPIKYGVFKRRP